MARSPFRTLKFKVLESSSLEFQNLKKADKILKKSYGYSRAREGSKIGNSTIEFNVANHLLGNSALEGCQKLLDRNNDKNLSSELKNKIIQGKNEKELNKVAQKFNIKDKDITENAKELYALSQIAKELGAEFKIINAYKHGYEKSLVIYIDSNTENPEKVITTVLQGLGINNKKLIQDAINRFHNQEERIEQYSKETHHDREKDQDYDNEVKNEKEVRSESKEEGDNLSTIVDDEIIIGLSGVKENDKGYNNNPESTPQNLGRQQTVGKGK